MFARVLLTVIALVSCSDRSPQAEPNALSELTPVQDDHKRPLNLDKEPVNEWPSWLAKPHQCPGNVVPTTFVSDTPIEVCAENLSSCLKRCKNSDGTSCDSAGIVVADDAQQDQGLSTALFARACLLGNASGCTNWATNGLARRPELQEGSCYLPVFKATCEEGHDAWGCSMWATLTAMRFGILGLSTIETATRLACEHETSASTVGACDVARERLKRVKSSLDQ